MATFTFNGISSDTYGLKIIEMPPPSRGGNTVESITIPGRPEQLTRSIEEYENTELEFEVMITDISKTRDIFQWLKGNGKLVYSDEPDKYYNVISNDVISAVRISDELRRFVIRFICSPFAYSIKNDTLSHIFTDIKDSQPEKTIKVTVGGSDSCEPLYFFRWAGRIEMTVNGGAPLIIDSGTEQSKANSGVIGEAVSAEKDMETNSVIVNGELGRTHGEYTDTYTPSGNGTPIYHYLSPEAAMFINTSLRLAYKLENGVRKVCCEMTSGKFPMLEPGENTVKFRLMPEYTWEHTMPDGTVRQYKHTEQKLLVFDVTPNTRWL